MQVLVCSDPSSRRRRHCPDSASLATPVTGALQCICTPTCRHAASMRSRTSLHTTHASQQCDVLILISSKRNAHWARML